MRIALHILTFALLLPGMAHAAGTLEDLVARQRELETLKLDQQLEEVRNKKSDPGKTGSSNLGASASLSMPLPGQIISTPTPIALPKEDFVLLGVYGVGKILEAEIRYQGSILTVSQGGEIADGWTLAELKPRSARIQRVRELPPPKVKANAKKRDQPQQLAKREVDSFTILIVSTGTPDVERSQGMRPPQPVPQPQQTAAVLPPLPAAPRQINAPAPIAPGALLPSAIRTN